jgi:hypothetical protein
MIEFVEMHRILMMISFLIYERIKEVEQETT